MGHFGSRATSSKEQNIKSKIKITEVAGGPKEGKKWAEGERDQENREN